MQNFYVYIKVLKFSGMLLDMVLMKKRILY